MRPPSVVILGLGRGTGLACGHRFADAGWSVMVVDGNRKTLDRAENELGKQAHYLHEDQTTRLGLKNALSGTLEQYDGVDAVLHVPSHPEPTALVDMDMSRFSEELQKSTLSAMMAGQIFGAEMIRELEEHASNTERPPHPKSFLQIVSMAAALGDPGEAALSVTHGSLLSVMRALAVEYASKNIRSNAIVASRPRPNEAEPWLKSRTPLGRNAKAKEVAEASLFVSSTAAGYMTGQTIVLDGGRSALNSVMPTD
ncbi:MAG: hypothetical protein CMK09_02610 [Ponticaulis sp.]|nr:hypothetical protein [Ponticaulis sp.]|tara:strand:- start:29568 stop:30332 length:765 start_codon:yes stop_codon:yes gene_type:complete